MLCTISFENLDCRGGNCIWRYFYDFTLGGRIVISPADTSTLTKTN